MKQNDFPRGWDKEKLGRVLAHYEGQTEEEAAAEDEVAAEDEDAMRPSETVMSVPHDLVPTVRELIAKRRG
jgi:type II secretory pathway component PulC